MQLDYKWDSTIKFNIKILNLTIKTDSAQRSSNKCKKYLPKNYSLNAIWNISL